MQGTPSFGFIGRGALKEQGVMQTEARSEGQRDEME